MNQREIAAAFQDAEMGDEGYMVATVQTINDVVPFFDYAREHERDLFGAILSIEDAEEDPILVVIFNTQDDVPLGLVQGLTNNGFSTVEKAMRGAYCIKVFGDVSVSDIREFLE